MANYLYLDSTKRYKSKMLKFWSYLSLKQTPVCVFCWNQILEALLLKTLMFAGYYQNMSLKHSVSEEWRVSDLLQRKEKTWLMYVLMNWYYKKPLEENTNV